MGGVATALGTMAAIIGVGWLLAHAGTLGPGARPILARACFSVSTPCLLFVTVAHAELNLLLARSALVGALSTTTVALVAIVLFAFVWRRPAPDVVVGTLASSYINAGNLGLPSGLPLG